MEQSLAFGCFSAAARGPRFPCPLDCTGASVASCLGKLESESGLMSGAAILLETHTHKNDACAFFVEAPVVCGKGQKAEKGPQSVD